MPRTLLTVTVLFFTLLFSSSCELFDREEPIPSYIHIEKIDLSTSPLQGTASHNITDVWVICGSEFIGAFELPATIPILAQGEQTLTLQAGIKLNGIASTRSINPFFAKVEMQVTLVPDSIINISMNTTYDASSKFPWLGSGQEGFEDGGISFNSGPNSDTSMGKTSDPAHVFEGAFSGIISLDTANKYYEGISTQNFILPKLNSPVVLELNYKTNNRFSIGIYANTATQKIPNEILVVNPSSTWNKIYVNLTPAVSRNYNAIDYNVFFEAIQEDSVDAPRIFLDNIKLVHF
jgi:hypothetical protein